MTENKNGWTPERRAAQRQRILENKPWEKSTGPKTLIGKEISSTNALKHGNYSAETRAARHVLRQNKQFMKEVSTLKYYILKNKLKKELKRRKRKIKVYTMI